ncbi:uncharacterized protein LOC119069860 [Bradysia coprophila]|uniref:uncharacterized protein LOC119069860 n=1 Tax=Bradysia coprophila TaxID=38358 RepID=UPI00187D78BF|nr:uncharacterized protein LOC119069860 [Bradysia coprophila]
MLHASTSKDDGQISKAKRSKTEDNCPCSGKCLTSRCVCVKAKRDCGSTCKCKSKCKNVFGHLEYFFGADTTCDINPCFEQWLMKNAKNGVETIDRNALRDQITSSANFADSALAEEWKDDDAEEDDISKTQELFRIVFSRSSDLYYSFCDNELLEDDSYWHCDICKTCNKWRFWHCDKCNKCTYGQSLPCERCGRSSAESSDESESPFFPFF